MHQHIYLWLNVKPVLTVGAYHGHRRKEAPRIQTLTDKPTNKLNVLTFLTLTLIFNVVKLAQGLLSILHSHPKWTWAVFSHKSLTTQCTCSHNQPVFYLSLQMLLPAAGPSAGRYGNDRVAMRYLTHWASKAGWWTLWTNDLWQRQLTLFLPTTEIWCSRVI